jgi:hypothetical protein
METHARGARIADKLKRDLLPKDKHVASWAGFGKGRLCDGCDESILGADVEDEFDFPDGRTIRFHAACAVLWRRMTGQ